ncbi:MAG: enoyl-CoA hydratase/isomerase family protein [Candidatus Marinimicrobia bacterium]|nr:enoyl-CoA hydratase/isomerase family protein [Candidatus Neomarinimicrobiota bacterium]
MNNSAIKISKYETGIVRVTLNQPEIHNAFDEECIGQLTATFKDLDNDKSVRVLILDAAGKSFSAGADLNWMKKMAEYSYDENDKDSQALADLMSTLYQMKCPTIAAVQGSAYGGGVGLVACCDIAIASRNASFCFSEVKLGLIPAVISPFVVKAIGERAAKRYFITAERFDANRALELGLISESVDEGDLAARVMSIAELIIDNGPEAVIAAKELINDVSNKSLDDQLKMMTANRIAEMRASNQGKEGVNAFLEKRKANWEQN